MAPPTYTGVMQQEPKLRTNRPRDPGEGLKTGRPAPTDQRSDALRVTCVQTRDLDGAASDQAIR